MSYQQHAAIVILCLLGVTWKYINEMIAQKDRRFAYMKELAVNGQVV
jgi:hypothetical protein